MPRSFHLSVDSPAGVGQILSAFGDEQYWKSRLAAFDSGAATLDGLAVDPDGVVTVNLTVSLFANRLQSVIAALAPGDFTMARTETWHPTGDDRARGTIEVAVPGAPVNAVGQVQLTPLASGSRLEFSTTVQVDIPLVGGQVGNFILGRLGDEIRAVQRFTNRWIAENR
jgi:hypothetical protein